MQAIEGVYVANLTPFKDNASLEIDVEAYLAHASWLGEMGVRGIVPFGSNGEGPSVTLSEKLGVLEALFERELPVQVIPSVMQGNLPETIEMLEVLEDYPAAAVIVLPPYYFKPATADGLRRFYEPVLETTRHPVIVYHIPKYAVPVPEEVLTGLPVWGVKDSEGEPGYAEAVLEAGKGVLLGTGGKALSERLQRARAMTKEYASAAVLKKLAEARHGAPMGTVRPPFVPAPAEYDPKPVLAASSATPSS